MKRTISLAALALVLVLAVGCAPKDLPMDQFSFGLPQVELEVEIPLEVPLTLPQIKGLAVEAVSASTLVEARLEGDLLTLTGTGETQGELVTLNLSAPGYNPASVQLIAAVALHPMELAILGPAETEDVLLDNPLHLEVEKGEQLVLPLSAPLGASLTTQVEGTAVTAAIQGESLVLTAVEDGEAGILVDAALGLHQPAQAQLTVVVKLKLPPPVSPATGNGGAGQPQQGAAAPQTEAPPAPAKKLNQQPSTDWADTSTYSQAAGEIVALVNAQRAAAGLSPLTQLSGVNILAAVRAREAAEFWSHQRPDGRDFDTIFGDNAMSYSHLGENLHAGNYASAGSGTASAVVDAFMASPDHRANILRPAFTGIGVGVYFDGSEYFFCQLFVAL